MQKKTRKYAEGGVLDSLDSLTTGDPTPASKIPLPDYKNPQSRLSYAQSFRNKYGKEALKGYGDIPLRINEKPVYGTRTSKQAAIEEAKALGLNPALFYASAMIEGQSGLYADAYKDPQGNVGWKGYTGDKEFPISGSWGFGLDSFADYYPSLVKKGYLPKDFDKQFKIWDGEADAPEGSQGGSESSMFRTADAGIKAKAAMMRAFYDESDAYASKKGYKLTPEQRDYFALAHFNSGAHGYEMMDAYNKAGLLKNNDFITSGTIPKVNVPFMYQGQQMGAASSAKLHQQIYGNIAPRIAAARGLQEEGLFEYGGKMPAKPYANGGTIDPEKPGKKGKPTSKVSPPLIMPFTDQAGQEGTVFPNGATGKVSPALVMPEATSSVSPGLIMPTEDGKGFVLPNGETVYGRGKVGLAPVMPGEGSVSPGLIMPYTTPGGEEGTIYPNGATGRVSPALQMPTEGVSGGFVMPFNAGGDEGLIYPNGARSKTSLPLQMPDGIGSVSDIFPMPIKANTKLRGVKEYAEGGEIESGDEPPTYSDQEKYYRASAKLSHYKGLLNDKLKAKNPEAFSSFFQSLTPLRRSGKSQDAQKYIQDSKWNDYLSVDEVKKTLGNDYQDYLESIQAVNSYDVSQGRQPLYGTKETGTDLNSLNYGRRFASLALTPSYSAYNQTRGTRYSRDYIYDPSTKQVSYKEAGDVNLRPNFFSTMKKGGRIPKYANGTEDPIKGIQPVELTNNSKVDPWAIANEAPDNPYGIEPIAIPQLGGTPVTPPNIQPLSQFYDTVDIGNGQMGLQGTGSYVNDQGQTTSPAEQQAGADQLSEANRIMASRRDATKDGVEMAASAGMTAINAYFSRQNASQQNRKNKRNDLMKSIYSQSNNPYLNGTGSQAIMENGGTIHIKPENRGKFTAAAERAGKSVQAYAAQIMAHPDNYSSTLVKRANFARNAAKWHEYGGEIEGEDMGVQMIGGGKAKMISSSDHSNPMMKFTGREHTQGGIGIGYNGTVAEVEDKEIGWVDNEGGLNIFGKLKLPGTNQTFRKTAEDIAEQEKKVDGKKSKYLNILNNGDATDPYQESARSTAKVMFKSLDKQSKQIAEKKEALASYQNLILNMAEMQGQKMAYGGKLPRKPYAEGGEVFGPEDPINIIPLKKDFKKGDRDLKNIKGIVLHKTAGTNSAKSVIAGWDSDNRQASADFIIDKDGTITQVGDLGDTKWHSGRKSVNKTTFGIELVGSSADESDVTPEQYKALGRLQKEVFAPMGITADNYYGHTQVNKKKGFDFADPNSIKNVLMNAGISKEYNPVPDLLDPLYSGEPSDLAQAEDAAAAAGTPMNTTFSSTSQNAGMTGYGTGPNLGSFINTKYGPARRNANAFSDKAEIVSGNRQRDYQSPLAFEQIAPELLTIATNRTEAVPAMTYQPELKQTFDISYQLGRNENQATFNQVARAAEQSGNIDALGELAAQKYKADQAYNVQEVQGNAQQRLQTYGQNIDVLNDARLKNLAIIGDQQVKQAQARFNTRKEDIATLKSISAKVAQNELENRTYNAYANLFKHYGFDKKGNVTFNPDNITRKFNAGEAQQFGMMAAQQGAQAIMNGDFSRQFTKVKNADGSQTTTETLGTNKKIQEEYKALKSQGFDDGLIGNMLRAKYPEVITQ